MVGTIQDIRNWLRYLHEYLSHNNDGRTPIIRELIYSTDSKIVRIDCNKIIQEYNDAYPDIKSVKEFTRDFRIESILNKEHER